MNATRALLAVIAVATIPILVREERRGASEPVPEPWVQELHPLLGAAPEGSFARDPEARPWVDFRGHAFGERGEKARVLVVGGEEAAKLLPRVEALVGARAEVASAARCGFGTFQEGVVVARFGAILEPTIVVEVDGEELGGPDAPCGWTPEWCWNEAACQAPLGERLARRSGLARRLWVPRHPAAEASAREERYLRGVKALKAIASAKGLRLIHVFETGPGVEERRARAVGEKLEERGETCRARDLEKALERGLR